MKPIEFMDALGDVREEYVRQMLDEEESSAERGKVSGAVLNTELPIAAGADGSRRLSDAGRPFGGKLRYAALLASAAACIAAVVGIMHLHQDSSDNLIAESMLQEVQIETGTTTVSESAAADVTTSTAEAATETHTTTTKAASTGSTQSVTVTTQTTVTAAGVATSGEESTKTVKPDTTASAAQTTAPAKTTTTVKTTTSSKTTTTISTTTAPRTTEFTTTTTIPHEPEDPDAWPVVTDYPYEQPYLLGDVDADGDVTLIDFFLVWRADTIYSRTGKCIIDEAAADRGNIKRVLINYDVMESMNDSDVRDLAIFRAFLGRPDLTAEGMDQLWFEGTSVDGVFISTAYTELMSVYEPIQLNSVLSWYNSWVIVGECVPKPIRDFYNDALGFVTLPGGGEAFALDLWTDEEFEQKMDELRTLLAQYKTT